MELFKEFEQDLTALSRNWGWLVAGGIAYMIIGIIAFSSPVATTVGVTFLIGALLLVSGIVQLIQGIRFRKTASGRHQLLLSAVPIIGGVLMLRFPAAGMVALTLTLAFYLFMSAFARWAVAGAARPNQGWGWLFASSIVSFVLGVYVLATMPVSALFLPGLVLGIDLVVFGMSLIATGFSLRRISKGKVEAPTEERKAA